MKNIKDITISIFAILGFVFVLTSFTSNGTQETQQVVNGTPETHVWEITDNGTDAYMWNKVTGETRILTNNAPEKYGIYKTLSEAARK